MHGAVIVSGSRRGTLMTQRLPARCLFILLLLHAAGCVLSDATLNEWNGAATPPAPAQSVSPASAAPQAAAPTEAADTTPVVPITTGQVAGMPAAAGSSAAASGPAGTPAAAGAAATGPAAGGGGSPAAAGSPAASAAAGGGGATALEPGALQCPMEVCAPLPAAPAGTP